MTYEIHPHGGLRQARAAEVASRQWGNITRRQLRDAGFSSREIDGMVERGLLHRMHDDAERDAWLEAHRIEVWRVDRDTWHPHELEQRLRHRLCP